jgi:methyl-coenzyme M reductase subunit D
MKDNNYPQCQIIPIRMLHPDNAEKFLDGLTYIPGVRRVLVHGPGIIKEAINKPRDILSTHIPTPTDIKIANQPIQMHILMGDVIIEALDEKVIDEVAEYCGEFFNDLAFQILVGKFIKTEPSTSDLISSEKISDPDFIGLSENKPFIAPAIIKQDNQQQCIV